MPAPRHFTAGPYQNPNQVRTFRSSFHNGSFRNCYFDVNCRRFGRRSQTIVYAYPLYTDAYYQNPDPQPVYPEPVYDNSAQTNTQLERLNYEVEQLRADRENARENQRRQEAPPKDLGPITPTILVFADGHRVEVNNYAIVGKTVWILSDHTATQKVQLSQLDLPATKKANDDNGVDFVVP